MTESQPISPLIRALSGLIGVLGFAAIAFETASGDGLRINFLTVAKFIAGFVFLYVALFGTYPWIATRTDRGKD